MRDALRRFQFLLAVTQLTLGFLALGDVPTDAAVADKASERASLPRSSFDLPAYRRRRHYMN
jgi:hypothetical protein